MATGTVTLFNQFYEDVGKAQYNLETDSIMVALVTNTVVPTAADPLPNFGGALSGGTDYSANEVAASTSYVAGGLDIAATFSQTSGVATLDGATNPSWAQDASGATNIYYGIIYDTTNAGKRAIGFVDLGGPVSLVAGSLTVNWNASGIASWS